MASGSHALANSGSKGFDFATDDILCSYEDYDNQDSNGSNSDPAADTNSIKDFNKSRLSRPEMYAIYNQPEDSVHEDMFAIIDRSMKKHVDNIIPYLEKLSSRLSQLELYCYNVDKSVGEMRHEMTRDHSDAELNLMSLDKHIQEVHRSVQIFRDKQELADTKNVLGKLQLAQKETSSGSSQSNEDKSSAPASDSRKTNISPNASIQQLALTLPQQHQPAQQQESVPLPPQKVLQQRTYYLQQAQIPNQSTATQIHYIATDPQGRASQLQEISRAAQPQMNQTQNMSPYPHYQQQWSQQLSQPMQPPPQQQPSLSPPQMRTPSPSVYSPYASSVQPIDPSQPQQTLCNSSLQMQYSRVSPPVTSRADSVPYGYSAQVQILQQEQPIKGAFGQQPGDVYAASTLPPCTGYVVYESERGRPHFLRGVYPSAPNRAFQTPQANPTSNLVQNNTSHPQDVRNHPYIDDKMMNMGLRGDHGVSMIQQMEESGQPLYLNGNLDRFNGQVNSQTGWSG